MSDENRINFAWLLRLRWGALVGQLGLIVGAHTLLELSLPLAALFAVLGVEAVSNLLAHRFLSSGRAVTPTLLGGVMVFDLLLFTGLLALTGGTSNPFSFLYLVHLALAAVVLSPRWTWALVALSLVGLGALFALPNENPHALHMRRHLQGMWLALGVAAAFIVYFVQRVRAELTQARWQAATRERLASLATLSAGAAHELSTPLSTIAVVSKELERRLVERGVGDDAADAKLIREQVQRCSDILAQMAADAGDNRGEGTTALSAQALVASALEALPGAARVDSDVPADATVLGPPKALAHAVRGVVKNALQASAPDGRVRVRLFREGAGLSLEVVDEGQGMSAPVLARLGEPFFTTKPPGEGMGLGMFLTRAVLQSLGGSVDVRSREGRGTQVTLHLPPAAR